MDEVVFLEVLEGDTVHARHRLERFPVTVGRGYGNDIILDDPKVSAMHLRLSRAEDGALVLHDVGSTNGTYLVEPWTQLIQAVLAPDARVAVGDTVLRFRTRNHPVERTWVGEAPEAPRKRFFEAPAVFPVALVSLLLLSVLSEHLSNFQKTDWGALALALVAPLGVLVWSSGWSVANRIARRQYQYRAHLSIGTLALLGVMISPMLVSVVSFSFSLGAGAGLLYTALYLGIMAWALYWHMRYVTRWSARRLRGVLAFLTLFFGLLGQADKLLGNEPFSPELPFDRTLLPPALRLVPARSVDDFFDDAEALQREVDALATQR